MGAFVARGAGAAAVRATAGAAVRQVVLAGAIRTAGVLAVEAATGPAAPFVMGATTLIMAAVVGIEVYNIYRSYRDMEEGGPTTIFTPNNGPIGPTTLATPNNGLIGPATLITPNNGPLRPTTLIMPNNGPRGATIATTPAHVSGPQIYTQTAEGEGNVAFRLRNPVTGKFVTDPANPPSPNVFTDAQRRAAWKQLAKDPNSGFTPAERAEIEARGWRGPQRRTESGELETMELSHEPIPLRNGGAEVVPRWPADHASRDPVRHLKKP
jgi:hypothetical protein